MSKLYSEIKLFNFSQKIKDISRSIISAPVHIRLKPTNVCNHNCYYCCYRNDNLYLGELMNKSDYIAYEKMRELIEDFSDMRVKAVTFSGGGEPLCYPYIKESIKSLAEKNIKIAMLTNAGLLNGENSEILAENAQWVRVSLDSIDSQQYAKIRNVSDSEFENVFKNIKNFVKLKTEKCEFGINFITTEENYSDIFLMLKKMKDAGVNHVKVSGCVVSTKGLINKDYQKQFVNCVKDQIHRGLSELADETFSVIDRFDAWDIENKNSYEKSYTSCPMLQCLTVIGADLNVYTCQDKAYTKSGILGSIKDKSFKDMWFSRDTKQNLLNLNPNSQCNHHCTQHHKNLMLLDYFGLDRNHIEFV